MRRPGIFGGNVRAPLRGHPALEHIFLEVAVVLHAKTENRMLTPAGEAAIPDQVALRQRVVAGAPFELTIQRAGAAHQRRQCDHRAHRDPGASTDVRRARGEERGCQQQHHTSGAGGAATAQKQAAQQCQNRHAKRDSQRHAQRAPHGGQQAGGHA